MKPAEIHGSESSVEETLREFTEQAQQESLKLGASEADIFAEASQLTEVYIERNEIQSEREKINEGLGIRCLIGKQLGFAYTTLLSTGEIEATANLAYRIAKSANPNPDWVELPNPTRFPGVEGIYDPRVSSLDVDDAVKIALKGLDAARSYDKRVNVDAGKLGAASSQVYLSNSHGVEGNERSTEIYLYLVTLATEGAEPGSFAFEYDLSTKLQIDPDAIGRRAAEKAVSSLGGKTPTELTGAAILTPDAGAEILASVLDLGVNGEEVHRKRSPLAGRIGEEIASNILTLTDDGTFPAGVGTSSFDDEGTARRRTPLIEKGVLMNYLYDSYAAHREGRGSTGNAARGGGGPRYASLPRTSHSNLLFEEGTQTLEEMIRDVSEGIVVGRFSGNITEASGDFSGSVKQGFYIKHGEIQFPLVRTMIAGNIYQILPKISSIGKPRKAIFDGTYIPPVRLEEVSISTEK